MASALVSSIFVGVFLRRPAVSCRVQLSGEDWRVRRVEFQGQPAFFAAAAVQRSVPGTLLEIGKLEDAHVPCQDSIRNDLGFFEKDRVITKESQTRSHGGICSRFF